jgi:hypothetical protein
MIGNVKLPSHQCICTALRSAAQACPFPILSSFPMSVSWQLHRVTLPQHLCHMAAAALDWAVHAGNDKAQARRLNVIPALLRPWHGLCLTRLDEFASC